jgi:hypothetical protein
MKLSVGIVIILLLLAGAYVLFGVVPDAVAERMNGRIIPPPYSASEDQPRHRDEVKTPAPHVGYALLFMRHSQSDGHTIFG